LQAIVEKYDVSHFAHPRVDLKSSVRRIKRCSRLGRIAVVLG